MFSSYSKDDFKKLNKQHNILVLTGNGFDVAVLNKFGVKNKTTSYENFFYWLKNNKKVTNNLLLEQMEQDKKDGKNNWSDFENTVGNLYSKEEYSVAELEYCLNEFQGYFTDFLNTIVDSQTLLEINEYVRKNKLTIQSLSYFLKDLPSNSTKFATKTNHYNLFNFVFANFNYTSLLDNYMYLDKIQFDPHQYKGVDTNFRFYSNNQGAKKPESVWSSYVLLDVIHPHGMQDVPRSILFGIDLESYDRGNSDEKRLVKGYWAQYKVKYEKYLDQADLFIIYGMSLGVSDSWWMDKIFENILKNKVELILYHYGTCDEESIKDKFIKGCIRHQNESNENKNVVKSNIYVKTFEENNTYFLGFEKII